MTRIVPVLAAGLLISPLLHAMPLNYTIATDKTAIALSWQAFGHLSQASLDGVTGNITLDAEKEMDDRIDVKIPISTLQASNGLLTYQLKSSLFFDAEHYPDIRFTSSRVVALGHGHFRVFGSLSVKIFNAPLFWTPRLKNMAATYLEKRRCLSMPLRRFLARPLIWIGLPGWLMTAWQSVLISRRKRDTPHKRVPPLRGISEWRERQWLGQRRLQPERAFSQLRYRITAN